MNVLVTALGTMASQSVVNQLKKREDIYIVGVDMYPKEYIVSSKDVDKFIQVVTVLKPEEYLNQLLELCINNKIDAIFPVIDEEVQLLAENAHRLKEIGTTPCVSNLESINLCRDKYSLYVKTKECIPEIAIETMKLSEYSGEWEFPLFVKPREGRASIGCYKVNSIDDLDYIKNNNNINDFIIQKFYEGQIIAADVVRDAKNNRIQVLAREELMRNKNGAGTVVKIIHDEYLEELCSKIAEICDLNGAFNIEFIKNMNDYRMIEINPRFPAGTDYSCMAGLDLVNNQLNIMLGMEMVINKFRYGDIYARRYETYVMSTEQ